MTSTSRLGRRTSRTTLRLMTAAAVFVGSAAAWPTVALAQPSATVDPGGELPGPVDTSETASASLRQTRTQPGLTLTDATVSIEADDNVRFTYELSAELAELLEPRVPVTATAPDDLVQAQDELATDDGAAPVPGDPELDDPDPAPEPEPEPDDQVLVRVTVYDPLDPDNVLDRARVDAIIGAEPDANAFQSAIDGVQFDDGRSLLRQRGDVTAMVVDVPTRTTDSSFDDLLLSSAGLFPLRITVVVVDVATGEERTVASHGTIVERVTDVRLRSREISVAFLAEVAGSGDRAVDELDYLANVAAGIDTPLTVSVAPWQLPTSSDEEASWAAAFANAFVGDEFLARPVRELDPSSVAAAAEGPESEIRSTYIQALLEGEDALNTWFPEASVRRDAWVPATTFSSGAVELVRQFGARIVVATPGVLARSLAADGEVSIDDLRRDQAVDVELTNGSVADLIVADEDLGSQLFGARDPIEAEGDWAVRTMTKLIIERDQAGTGPRQAHTRVAVIDGTGVDRDTPVDIELISTFEDWVRKSDSFRMVSVADMVGRTTTQTVDAVPTAIALRPTAGPGIAGRLDEIALTRLALASTATMLLDNELEQQWNAELDTLLSTGVTDEQSRAVIDRLGLEAQALRDSISAPDPFTFTLTGRTGDIVLRLRNNGEIPLQVLVRVTSPKLTVEPLADQEGDERVTIGGSRPGDRLLTLPADSTEELTVPVRARANGTSKVTVELFTPSGQPLGERTELTSRVNALTGFGQVLTGGFVLVLLSWWLTHWRARRRESIAAAEAADRASEAVPPAAPLPPPSTPPAPGPAPAMAAPAAPTSVATAESAPPAHDDAPDSVSTL